MKNISLATLLAMSLSLPAMAANFGDAQRQYTLGNYLAAYDIWMDLAEAGDARSQYSLALLYFYGLGVDRDLDMARSWATKAVEREYRPALSLLEALQRTSGGPATATPTETNDSGDESQTSELTKRMETTADQFMAQIDALAGSRLKHGGATIVSRDADGIEMVVPDVVWTDDSGGVFNVGILELRIEPGPSEFDTISAGIPDRILFTDPDGRTGAISIGWQTLLLVWDRTLATSSDFDLILGDLAIRRDGDGAATGKIGEVGVVAKVLENNGGWSGPIEARIFDISLTNGRRGALELAGFRLQFDVHDLDLPKYLHSLADNGNTRPSRFDGSHGLLRALSAALELDGLRVEDERQGRLSLDRARYRLWIDGMDGDLADITLEIGHEGLVGHGPSAPGEAVPQELQLAVAMARLPADALLRFAATMGVEMALMGEVTSAETALPKLGSALARANSELRIERGSFAAPAISGSMVGKLQANGDAPFGMAGEVKLQIDGLSDLQAKLSELPADQSKDLRQVIPLMLAYGEPASDGRSHSYHLQITPDGVISLNGKPLMAPPPPSGTNKNKP